MSDLKSTNEGMQADEFEEQVRRSLRHVEAPKDFAVRVLERAAAAGKPLPLRPRLRHKPHRRWRKWIGVVAAIVVLVVLLANQARIRRERARVAQIQAQFDTAMRVTSGALEQTRMELERAGVNFGE